MAGNLGGEQRLLRFGCCHGHVVGVPARIDGPGDRGVDQFVESCWVAPFVEDSVPGLAEHLPVERILFGSDCPHAEGLGSPGDFFKNVEAFPLDDQRKIMQANAHELTFALPSR